MIACAEHYSRLEIIENFTEEKWIKIVIDLMTGILTLQSFQGERAFTVFYHTLKPYEIPPLSRLMDIQQVKEADCEKSAFKNSVPVKTFSARSSSDADAIAPGTPFNLATEKLYNYLKREYYKGIIHE